MEAIRFNNGNIHIHGGLDKSIRESTLIQLLWALEDVDTGLIGEEYCISNYDMGITVYSYYSDLVYTIAYSQLYRLEKGKTLILKGMKPSEYDRELIAAEA